MPVTLQDASVWDLVRTDLREEIPADLFDLWLDRISLVSQDSQGVTLAAPNEMVELWVTENFLGTIVRKFRERTGSSVPVKLRVQAQPGEAGKPEAPSPAPASVSAPRAPRRTKSDNGSVFGGTLNPKNTFESFIVGANNEMAHAAAMSVARAPGSAYNPLLIYGGTGLGKTHLMHAIGHYVVRSRPDARVAYVTSEKFTNDFINSIGEGSLRHFRERYRGVDLLLIDDIQFFSGKERSQDEFFHTFNDLIGSSKQIVLTCDRPVNEIQNLEHRLLSRFNWGMSADICAPDLETRTAILRRKSVAMGFEIPADVVSYIASHITSNIRQLEGALIKVGTFMKVSTRLLDARSAEDLLRDFVAEESVRQISAEAIQKKVAEHFGLRIADLVGRRRPNNIAQPRQIAMFLCREFTRMSLQDVGEAFGGRDHGTVIHACKAVHNAMEQDAQFRATVEFLRRGLAR
jgi:chromosomal replication initiator protein